MRVRIDYEPFARQQRDWDHSWSTLWPARWVSTPEAGPPPFVTAYRLGFSVPEPATARVHATADERYELFLDGGRLGRGPERGHPLHWFFETYDLELPPGPHVLVARVWSLGRLAPTAQMTVRPGFLLAAEPPFTEVLGTGTAAWACKRLGGYEFLDPGVAWGTGARLRLTAATFPWDFQLGDGPDWRAVEVGPAARGGVGANHYGAEHLLRPARLPAMIERPRPLGRVRHVSAPPQPDVRPIPVRQADDLASETAAWRQLLEGRGAVTVPPGAVRRVLIDLDDYTTAYPEVVTSGGDGGLVRLHWAEALYTRLDDRKQHHAPKGNRDEVEGKFFAGVGDVFLPDGGPHRRFETLWWASGRYLELVVQAAHQPLVVERVALRETRYPLEAEGRFACSDPRTARVFALGLRALQLCAHETYLDCPYYEQLMYVGDARVQALTTYALTRDDRLPRKAILLFDESRGATGLTRSQYPSRVTQLIPPFSLWWVAMVHDFACWRDDPAFVRGRLPGVRAVLDYFLGRRNRDGLVEAPEGWNFTDWVPLPGWRKGVPPGGADGVSAVLNLHLALALTQAAELEAHFGEPEPAARNRRAAGELWRAVTAGFWDGDRALPADDPDRRHFSEHAPCLALLCGLADDRQREELLKGLLAAPGLARASIYFSHYLLEAYRRAGDGAAILARLDEWFELERLGFRTTREEPEPSRSDCHAWGAHPLYHFLATVLGIRPAGFGFRAVRIAPLLGRLTEAEGELPHPLGRISVGLRVEGGRVRGAVVLPAGLTGTFHWAGQSIDLHEGMQTLDLPCC